MKRLLQASLTIVLVYLAFQKIDVRILLTNLLNVPVILVVFTILYSFFSCMFSSWRWGIFLLKTPSLRDVLFLTKCSYQASFYSFFLPSSMSGDLIRWIPLIKKYPEKSKTALAGSVLVDRVVGATAFFPLALISVLVGMRVGFFFPNYLLWLFVLGCLSIVLFYLLVFKVNLGGFLEQYKFTRKFSGVVKSIKREHRASLLKGFFVSLLVQLVGTFPFWVRSELLGAGFSLLSVYIFVPIISLVLMLPISVAGFGAREQLFLFFFSQTGSSSQEIILVSTFSGIAAILVALVGGITTLPAIMLSRKENT